MSEAAIPGKTPPGNNAPGKKATGNKATGKNGTGKNGTGKNGTGKNGTGNSAERGSVSGPSVSGPPVTAPSVARTDSGSAAGSAGNSSAADAPHVDGALAGWGNHPRVSCRSYRPTRSSELPVLLRAAQSPSVLARGAGCAYGDAALNSDGGVIDLQWLDRFLEFDVDSGVLRCEGGVTVRETLDLTVARGWFLPVVPGTAAPTLGGLFAADVHGKNHHGVGSFQRHVRRLTLTLATGERVECSAEQRPQLFHATAGGMGLTGVISELELQLQRIPSAYVRVLSQRTRNLSETMQLLTEGDRRHQYSVAWLDGIAKGAQLGRGTTLLGDPAFPADVPDHSPFSTPPARRLNAPKVAGLFLNDLTMKIFNKFQHLRAPSPSNVSIEDYRKYFFPLDALGRWNDLYGKRGFVQYQFVIPIDGAEKLLSQFLEGFQQRQQLPYLLVLKRFGEGCGMLSFPQPGWTLACDLPVRPGLFELLAEFDQKLLEHGGRVYLAKDCCLSADNFRRMYPQWESFAQIKAEVDPEGRFQSDLSRRLGLSPR